MSSASDRNLYIPSLDGIRAVAACLVFVAHAGLLFRLNLAPGGFGVTIFFFLSGYLITTLLRLEYERAGHISLRNFYLRRAYRILPPLYLVLAFGMLLVWVRWAPGGQTAGALLSQITNFSNYYILLHGEDHLVPGMGSTWSLAVEEHFYLLYPVLLIVSLRRYSYRRTAHIMLLVCAVELLWRYVLVYGLHASSDYTYEATDTRLDSILYGCIMGLAFNPTTDPKVLDFGQLRWAMILVASLLLLGFCFVFREPWFRDTLRYTLQGIGLFPVFFCAVRYSTWPVFAWLNTPPVRGLGIISYTFYLIHLTALGQGNRLFGGHDLAVVGFGLASSILFSVGVHFLVERRMSACGIGSTSEQMLAATPCRDPRQRLITAVEAAAAARRGSLA